MNSISIYFSAAVSSQILLFLVSHVNLEDVIILIIAQIAFNAAMSYLPPCRSTGLGMRFLGVLHHPSPHHEVGDHPVENWHWSRKSFYKRWESQESIHSCIVTCGSVAPTSSTVRIFFLARASSLQDFNGNSVLSCNTGEKFPSQSSQPLWRDPCCRQGWSTSGQGGEISIFDTGELSLLGQFCSLQLF